MKAILKYRIPGQQVVSKEGAFTQLTSLEDYNGFIVSDFLFQKIYGFIEGAADDGNFTESWSPIVDTKEDYIDKGQQVIASLKGDEVQKIVLSRIKKIATTPNKELLFNELCDSYPNAFVYWIDSGYFGAWIGATPEVLLDRRGERVRVMALAGTKQSEDSTPWSAKEIEEQTMVASYVREKLTSINQNLDVSESSEHIAGPVKHLVTEFYFSDHTSDEELIRSLHPTPAVSGLPQKKAIEKISEIEGHDRELYSGVIGVTDENSKLYVNLRCMRIYNDICYLFVGGGYTVDSDVEQEWDETENKAKTLVNILKKQ